MIVIWLVSDALSSLCQLPLETVRSGAFRALRQSVAGPGADCARVGRLALHGAGPAIVYGERDGMRHWYDHGSDARTECLVDRQYGGAGLMACSTVQSQFGGRIFRPSNQQSIAINGLPHKKQSRYHAEIS